MIRSSTVGLTTLVSVPRHQVAGKGIVDRTDARNHAVYVVLSSRSNSRRMLNLSSRERSRRRCGRMKFLRTWSGRRVLRVVPPVPAARRPRPGSVAPFGIGSSPSKHTPHRAEGLRIDHVGIGGRRRRTPTPLNPPVPGAQKKSVHALAGVRIGERVERRPAGLIRPSGVPVALPEYVCEKSPARSSAVGRFV